ncbi:LacI family DNA-binding transcriptional regulator [Tessaracoccus sp. OS52]|uniref:LacI family DNA-binding transcriptional regulator n=1 Tax=Tessaracoccus sp. OS52 TaxID=2886691 RepID=UPI001D1150BB|nr:LacI family DNA-binding transcriptional regulator [Tessaracoccus sp. OS52]MCC2592431.1 LacI family DNA-binding transcriptional regulator [Tessaracoccus sp. OS52]
MAQRSKRPPGMMAVARLAGVSHQTVSRVLNQPETVRPVTQEKVLAAMRELGYSRNLAARSLVTQQTSLLGVVWTGAHFLGPSSTVGGIEVAARAAGYSTLVGALEEFDEDEVADLFRIFRDRGVEGLAVVAPYERVEELARRGAAGIPTVLVADVGPHPDFHVASVDQELGGRLATGHMVERGCRRILHISGPLDWFDAQARARGWQRTLEEAGLEVLPVMEGDWSPDSGYALGQELLATAELPDGIFCGNDGMAVGLLAALRGAGVDVPGRVSVVGFDDLAGAKYYSPPLTTVAQPFQKLGSVALELLVRAIGGEAPTVERLTPELRVRASVR